MRAVILAGGKGSRLRPYTLVLPKPLVPVGDRPILQLILSQLARDGCKRVDLCVGHLGSLIQTYFADPHNLPEGMELGYHWEDDPLGTAGALRNIEGLDEPFLAMNGDILTDLDFGDLMTAHRAGDAALTIATHHKTHQVALGVIEHSDGVVRDYVEKPSMEYEVSMGVYAYSPRALTHIPEGYFDFPTLVKALLDAGEKVSTYRFEGTWFDIGTPADYDGAVARMDQDGATLLRDLTPTAVYPRPQPG
ncbi:MAG: nucleotidyltransferase family protein [Pseudonocardiaceae bacterium]